MVGGLAGNWGYRPAPCGAAGKNAYAPLVTVDSYIVAMDGIMEQVVGAPRTQPEWSWNNPRAAAIEFVEKNPSFIIENPPIPFNEGRISKPVTYWPDGYIKRIK